MVEASLAKLRTAIAPLHAYLALAPGPAEVVARCDTAADAVATLLAAGYLEEAVRVVAHGLPRREAVWWACMCATHTAPPDLPEADRAALEAAQAWVRRRGEAECRAAWDSAQKTAFATPEAWCAVAAFWSGDSLAPPDAPKVPPAAHLPGTAIAGSVGLATVRIAPARATKRLQAFLDSAREIASGGAGRLAPEAP